jgi:multidrug efflux pump subunit AcrA (membrane-fusion protein)
VADDLRLELGKLLDQYEDKRRTVEERRQQVKTDEDAYQKAFADLRIQVIRPVFDAAGAILKARGHDFVISEDEHAGEPAGKTREAVISMQIMPAGMEKSTQANAPFPSLSFITRHYNKTVCVRASNAVPKLNGTASPRGDYQLAQIDKELVQAELLKLIAGIVGR